MSQIRVALPVPLYQHFDYLLPEGLQVQVGVRVLVPFGKRELIGIVWQLEPENAHPDKLKALLEVLDQTPLFGNEIKQLLSFAADYYHHPLGEVLISALPALLRVHCLQALTHASGAAGMCGGQALDIDARLAQGSRRQHAQLRTQRTELLENQRENQREKRHANRGNGGERQPHRARVNCREDNTKPRKPRRRGGVMRIIKAFRSRSAPLRAVRG